MKQEKLKAKNGRQVFKRKKPFVASCVSCETTTQAQWVTQEKDHMEHPTFTPLYVNWCAECLREEYLMVQCVLCTAWYRYMENDRCPNLECHPQVIEV